MNRSEVVLREGRRYYIDPGSLVDHGDSIEFTWTHRARGKQFRVRAPWESVASVSEELSQ